METIRVKSKIVEHQNTFISRKTIKPPKFIDAYIYILLMIKKNTY